MITYGPYRLTGIKQNDITVEIDNIINTATEFIIICGYSFSSDRTTGSTLHKIINSPIAVKHCILPIKMLLPRGSDVNRDKAVRLINNNVSVSIEDLNHSKWIMTENSIYYGSANFSKFSLEQRIEVISLLEFEDNDALRSDFIDFGMDSMNRMFSHSDRRKLWGVLGVNDALIRSAQAMVLRYNPSIEKVIKTVDAIEDIKTSIKMILENCYWFLDDKRYYELTYISNKYFNIINSINKVGVEIIRMKEEDPKLEGKIRYYNTKCDEFVERVNSFQNITKDFLLSPKKVPSFTKRNRALIKQNRTLMDKLSNTQ